MAEGLVNHYLKGSVQAFSAGTEPNSVHPMAIEVMREVGVDISNHRSKGVDEFMGQSFDYVITLCDQAGKSCPVFLGEAQRLHMGFPDPAAVVGSEEEKLTAFRRVRDQIQAKVMGFLRDKIKINEGKG